jgi:hypothetical protein
MYDLEIFHNIHVMRGWNYLYIAKRRFLTLYSHECFFVNVLDFHIPVQLLLSKIQIDDLIKSDCKIQIDDLIKSD